MRGLEHQDPCHQRDGEAAIVDEQANELADGGHDEFHGYLASSCFIAAGRARPAAPRIAGTAATDNTGSRGSAPKPGRPNAPQTGNKPLARPKTLTSPR